MKKYAYRTMIFTLPLAVAAMLATGAVAEDRGRDGGGKPAVSGKFDGGGKTEFRGDRGGRDGTSFKADARVDRGDKGDRGVKWSDRGDRGNKFDGPRRKWSGDVGGKRHWRQGRRYSWGPGIAFYLSDGYYYGDCGWLKRHARETGSPIWWSRYRQCREAS